jgi:enoyl-[acyl-carrier protein] reductase I
VYALQGKKGLIIGMANEHSLAYGCARQYRLAGADLAITYLNSKAEPYTPIGSEPRQYFGDAV